MNTKKEYAGIDYFRLIAAILVISIHTSPLSSVNGTADFILTRIIARVAVPFFFMATGFFLFPSFFKKEENRHEKFLRFFRKTAILYLFAILLYFPINIYSDYFTMPYLIPNIVKDLLFDGTFYHLWYLPAVLIGASFLCLFLSKGWSRTLVFQLSIVLYLIALLGDSYYGLTVNIPILKDFYDGLFFFSDYTRNGLFFAPVFLLLGGLIGMQRKSLTLKKSLTGMGISVSLLLTEGLLLHYFHFQRHDSMYLFLLPCMYYLFQLLLNWNGKSAKYLRSVSMAVYIIHPFMILCVRGGAKLLHLQSLFIENSFLHFLAVTLASVSVAFLWYLLSEKFKKFIKIR